MSYPAIEQDPSVEHGTSVEHGASVEQGASSTHGVGVGPEAIISSSTKSTFIKNGLIYFSFIGFPSLFYRFHCIRIPISCL